MENLKKLLKINFITGKGYFIGIFSVYVAFIFIVLLNNLPVENSSALCSLLRGIFYLFTFLAIIYTPTGELNKKLLFSYPIDSVKTYSLSIAISQFIIVLIFYSVYFIFALFFNDIIFTNGMVWIINLALFSSILKTVSIKEQHNKNGTLILIFVQIIILTIFVFINYTTNILKPLNISGQNVSRLIFIILCILLLYRFFSINNNLNTVSIMKNKNYKKNKAILNVKESPLKFWIKIKYWSFNIVYLALFIYLLLSFTVSLINRKNINGHNMFSAVIFLPLLFIFIYDNKNIYDFTLGMPIDYKKVFLNEKMIKLFMFIVISILTYLTLTFTNIYEDIYFKNYYILALTISVFMFSIYEIVPNKTIFFIFFVVSIFVKIPLKNILIENITVAMVLLAISIVFYILTYLIFIKSLKNMEINDFLSKLTIK